MPIQVLCQRLELWPPNFEANQLDPDFAAQIPLLLAAGLLRESAPTRSLICECGRVARVGCVNPRGAATPVYFRECMACGPKRIAPEQLASWRVDFDVLIQQLCHAGEIAGSPTMLVDNTLWHLGHATWLGRRRQCFLLRARTRHDRQSVADKLVSHPRAVAFVPTRRKQLEWAAECPQLLVPLTEVLRIGDSRLEFDPTAVEDALRDRMEAEAATEPTPVPAGRGSRLANIAKLQKELIEHLSSAVQQIQSQREMNQSPTLLPRPNRKELGQRCGLTESDVSRCFSDDRARELNFYYDLADDWDRLLELDGRQRVETEPSEEE